MEPKDKKQKKNLTICKNRRKTISRGSWPSFRKTEQFHIATRANMTELAPHSSLNLAMSWWLFISFDPPLAITGMEREEAISLMKSFRFGWLERSCWKRPWTAIARTPHSSTILQNLIVSSNVGKHLILHVIGLETFFTRVVRILKIFFKYKNIISFCLYK